MNLFRRKSSKKCLGLPQPGTDHMNQPMQNGPEAEASLNSHDVVESEYRYSLVSRLQTIFQQKEAFKRLVSCQAPDAQKLLDTFQQLLDSPEIDTHFRRALIVAMQRISTKSGLHPTCYELKDIEQTSQYPVTSGGFADIYRGRFRGQRVCLKTLRLYETIRVEHALKTFSKEVLLWGQLSHPNVLAIFGLFHHQDRPSIVSLWMDNGNINEYLKSHPDADRQKLALDVGKGLSYLHDMGIIHGDLKGPNVLVNDAGCALLSDFGISSVMDSDLVSWTSQITGSKPGTVRWQAPELIPIVDGDDDGEAIKCTTASDVYAWACVMFEIFVGQVPFGNIRHDAAVVVHVQSGGRPRRPDASSPVWHELALTNNIWSCMEHCWDREPSQRPSAKEIIESLATGIHDICQVNMKTSGLSPADFRRQTSGPVEMLRIDLLDNILENGVNSSVSGRKELSTLDRQDNCLTCLCDARIAQAIQGGPLLLWVDDHPQDNEDLIAYAQVRGIKVLQFTSTSSVVDWIEINTGCLRRLVTSSAVRLISDNHCRDTSLHGSQVSAGEQVLRYLRKHSLDIPVLIFSSAVAQTGYVNGYLKSGSTGFKFVCRKFLESLADGDTEDVAKLSFAMDHCKKRQATCPLLKKSSISLK